MNELDSYMAEYAEKFNCGNRRKINPAFKKKLDVCRGKEQRLKRNISKMSVEEKEGLIAEIRELRRSLKSIPYSDQMDDSYKRLCYIRYADDFLIGVIGSKEDAEQIKQDVGCFIRDKLHLEMSEEKTLITHGHDAAKFLGYEVTIAKGEHNKKTKTGATRRVNNGKVLLYVPHDKWVKRLFSYNALKIKYDKQNGNKEVWEPVRRIRLLHLDDLEILNQYNAEIRGLYNYYRLANNVSVLNNFYYVMRYSMLKTFAGKYRTRISRIIRKYRQGKDFVVEYPKKNGKVGKVLFYNNGFRRDTKVESGNPDIVARVFENYGRNSLIKRLQANRCEWCGAENVSLEIHHIQLTKPGSSVANIDAKKYFLHNLFAAMLVPSGNDAAYVVADYCGSILSPQAKNSQERINVFMEHLNNYLQNQGYENTILYDPSGYDVNALTTVSDLKSVSTHLLEKQWFRDIVSKSNYTATLPDGSTQTWRNTNTFLDQTSEYYNENVKGIKTGSLSNDYNLVVLYQQHGKEFLICSLGSQSDSSRYDDVNYILKTIDESDYLTK